MNQVKTNNFMLATATVMLGPMADLHKLNPTDHGIGLVKNYTINQDKQSTDLNAGIQNDLVFSMTTQNDVRSTMEMYEYTAKNMAYALGLNGAEISELAGDASVTSAAGTNNGDKTHTITLTKATTPQDLTQASYVSIRNPSNDTILIAKVTDSSNWATSQLTVQVDIGTDTIPSGAFVNAVSILDLGSTDENKEFAAKVTGQLADGTWVSLLFPRIKVTSSFQAAFSSDNYGNMPFEWKTLKLLPSHTHYAEFKNRSAILAKDAAPSDRA